jgi:ribonucleoside-triphosphate reductase (thioredoxin)
MSNEYSLREYMKLRAKRRCIFNHLFRYFDYMVKHLQDRNCYRVADAQRLELQSAVLSLAVMPSMRALMTAGRALESSAIAAYNCSYLPVDNPAAFHEILYILMHGTGVGFSVERRFTGRKQSSFYCTAVSIAPAALLATVYLLTR